MMIINIINIILYSFVQRLTCNAIDVLVKNRNGFFEKNSDKVCQAFSVDAKIFEANECTIRTLSARTV